MTQLFRSKSCVLGRSTMFDSVPPPSPTLYLSNEEEEEEEEDEGYEEEDEEEERGCFMNPISTPLIVPRSGRESEKERNMREERQRYQFPILEILVEALRKSLICTVGREDLCALDIGWPTDVQHVSHVTFDRFHGFLGLPVEFEPEIPVRVPSASASVFGVSAESMQCVYDRRGNSVPTILLMMQRRLYSERGLQAEGIFRINAENSQEEYVRGQLNRGVVPFGVDVHCLAGLIKAWFRELPTGVLDSLTPDQVMHCNTEEECTQVVSLLPPTESALLDWAINLMADVVELEDHNKMNARNIAMVFAPNMTQMADPLTALLHAVQVMNLLKTLVMKILRERENSSPEVRSSSSCSESSSNKGNPNSSNSNSETGEASSELATDVCPHDEPVMCTFLRSSSSHSRLESDTEDIFWSFKEKSTEDDDDHQEFITSENDAPAVKCSDTGCVDNDCSGGYNSCSREEVDQRFSDSTKSWRQGVRKLYKHPVFQLSKSMKKPVDLGIVNNTSNSSSSREGSGVAAWV